METESVDQGNFGILRRDEQRQFRTAQDDGLRAAVGEAGDDPPEPVFRPTATIARSSTRPF